MDHLSAAELVAYAGRGLSARQLLAADRHMSICATCKANLTQVAAPAAAQAVLQGVQRVCARATDHLQYDQMEAYVDGRLTDSGRNKVQAHVESCPLCARELADLQQIARELARPLVAASAPVETPVPAGIDSAVGSRSSGTASPLGNITSAVVGWLRIWASPPVMGAMAMLLLAVVGVLLLQPSGGPVSSGPGGSDASVLRGSPASLERGQFDRLVFAAIEARGGPAAQALAAGQFNDLTRLLNPAAEQGDSVAQTALALLLLEGQGVTRDPAGARVWFERAANAGNASAAHNLGVMYTHGLGVERDPDQAERWYGRAQLLAAPR